MGLMKKLTSSLVASSLVLGLVGSAFAAPSADAVNDAFARLSHYNIVKGKLRPDGTVDPALNESITRAELVTIITRAFGQEETAKILGGASSFSDVPIDQWYTGYVALAKNMADKSGFPLGYSDGTFKPAKNVTNVEALAFIMKFLGVKPGTGANWAADTIKAAIEAGVITTADAEAYLDAPDAEATRGVAFGLADTVFGTYNKLAGGKSVYTAYVDTQAPSVTLDKAEPATTAPSVKLTGKVAGDYVAVMIGTEKITVNEDGTFAAEVKLALGENNISVVAKDLAGNEGTATVAITRSAGNAAKIEAGEIEIVAGQSIDLATVVKVMDANDAVIEGAPITVDAGSMGTYADGKFTAATKAGEGTITVTSGEATAAVKVNIIAGPLAKVIADKPSAAPGEQVTLTAADEFGNAVSGATYAFTGGKALLDSAKGVFIGSDAGMYTITATVGEAKATLEIGVFGEAYQVVLSAPEAVVNNGKTVTKLTATIVDEDGNVVTGYDKKKVFLFEGVIPTAGPTVDNLIEAFHDAKGGNILYAFAYQGVATFELTTNLDKAVPNRVYTLTAYTEDPQDDLALDLQVKGEAEVSVAGQKATSLKVTTPKYLAINSDLGTAQELAHVWVSDQKGEAMRKGEYEVDLKVESGNAYLLSDQTDMTSKETSYTFVYDGAHDNQNGLVIYGTRRNNYETGTITLSVTGDEIGTQTATLNAGLADVAKKFEIAVNKTEFAANAEGNATFTVQLLDRNGVPVSAGTGGKSVSVTLGGIDGLEGQVEVSLDEGATWQKVNKAADQLPNPFTVAIPEDHSKASFMVRTMAFTGTLTATASDSARPAKLTASAAASVNVVAGKVARVSLTAGSLFKAVPVGAPTTTLSGVAVDGSNNVVKKAGVPIEFEPLTKDVKLNGKARKITVLTDENGTAKVEASVTAYVGIEPQEVKIGSGDPALGVREARDTAAIAVINGAPKQVKVELWDLTNNTKFVDAPAGTEVEVRAYVYDTANKTLNYPTIFGNAGEGIADKLFRLLSLAADGIHDDDDTTDITAGTDGNGNTYYAWKIHPIKVGTFSATVKDSAGPSPISQSAAMTVTSAVASQLRIAELTNVETDAATKSGTGDLAVQKKTEVKLNATLTDAYGNRISGKYAIKFSAPDTDGHIVIRSASNGPDLAGSTDTVKFVNGKASFFIWADADGSIDLTLVSVDGGTEEFTLKVFVTAQD